MTNGGSDRLERIEQLIEAQGKQLEEIKSTLKDIDKRIEKLDNRILK